MSLLSVANLQYKLGDRVLLDGANLTVADGEHVGLVGRNGTGKSTLLKLIAGLGQHAPDGGQIQLSRDARAGYLKQDPDLNPGHTLREEAGTAFAELQQLHDRLDAVYEEMAKPEVADDPDALEKLLAESTKLEQKMHAAGGYAVEHKVDETLHGLGLTDELFDVPCGGLSGGQKGRLMLAKLLLSEPDILLLDEPTNHLDIAGREWLEEFLGSYRGAVVLISHDRWLLDRVVRKIYELEAGKLIEYPGNYQAYREQRAVRLLDQRRAFEKQQTKIKQEQSFIDRYRAGQRAKQAQGREKRLERYKESELLEAPPELDTMALQLLPKKRANENIVVAENFEVTYDDRTLFENFSLTIKRGDRIGVVGPNGAGKSTLVRCLLGQQQPTRGEQKLGTQVDMGFYHQTHEHLKPEQTVVDFLRPFTPGGLEQEARNLAGAFLFSGQEQDKPLGVMSGGERSRAVLASLVSAGHNLLVLDEPTNHLDIPSAERLEEALQAFVQSEKKYSTKATGREGGEGTLILITHDRMLLDHLVNQLIIFDGEGGVQQFLGTWSEYHDAQTAKPQAAQPVAPPPKKPQEKERVKPEGQKSKRSRGAERQLSQSSLEGRIEALETELKKIDEELAFPETYGDGEKVKRLQDRREKANAELKPLEAEWMARA